VNLLDAAREYCRRGWRVVPLPAGEKGPKIPGWQTLALGLDDLPRYFGADGNVGVILTSGLVDADLDCSEAIALAGTYLPETGAEFGRASKLRSHRLYIAPDAKFEAFADPVSKNTLLELRAEGRDGGAHQTLLPPSVTDGESRSWSGDIIAPAVVDARVLRRRMAWLAIGVLTMRYVAEAAARCPGPDLPRILWEFDNELGRTAYRWLGERAPDDPHWEMRPTSRFSQSEIDLAELVANIPNDGGWEDWNRIGMAIFSASRGSVQGAIIFDDWSAKSPKYNPYNTSDKWAAYRRCPPNKIGAGTLVYLAQQNGWGKVK
jgi:hypothetical protein